MPSTSAAIARWEIHNARWARDIELYRASIDDPLLAAAPWPGPPPLRAAAPYVWVAPR